MYMHSVRVCVPFDMQKINRKFIFPIVRKVQPELLPLCPFWYFVPFDMQKINRKFIFSIVRKVQPELLPLCPFW